MPNLLIVYSLLIVLASALGGALPSFWQFTHRRIQMTLSLVSGVMLGVALLHMLPHSIQILNQNINQAMMSCLGGLLFMFLLIRTFHFHQHDIAEGQEHDTGCNHEHHHDTASSPTTLHQLDVAKPDSGLSDLVDPAAIPKMGLHREFSWVGLTIGLALHTLVDGLALAAAYSAERSHGGLAALGTFLAIVLHKPLDAFTITSLMSARRASFRQQSFVNLVFALVCPVGAILFSISFDHWGFLGQSAIGVTLAFSAGVFLCISLGDLLPEVHFHSHDRVWLSFMLLLGVAIAWAIEWFLGHSHAIPVVSQLQSIGQLVITR